MLGGVILLRSYVPTFLVVIFRSSTLLLALVNDVVICDDCLQRRMEMSSTGIFSVSLKLYPGRYEVVNFSFIWSILLWPLEYGCDHFSPCIADQIHC